MKRAFANLTDHSVQSKICRTMQKITTFKIDVDMPDDILLKLEVLDRVITERTGTKNQH